MTLALFMHRFAIVYGTVCLIGFVIISMRILGL